MTLMMLNMLDEVINTVQLSSLIMRKIGKKKTTFPQIGAVLALLHPIRFPPSPFHYTVVNSVGIINPIWT